LSVTRPFDSSPALYCKRSIVTMRLSCIDTETWRLKDNGVTSLTFWGHVTSLFTWAFDSREPSSYGWSIETGRPTKLFTFDHGRHFASNIELNGCTNVYYRILNFRKKYLIFWPHLKKEFRGRRLVRGHFLEFLSSDAPFSRYFQKICF